MLRRESPEGQAARVATGLSLLRDVAWYLGVDLITMLREGPRVFDIVHLALAGQPIDQVAANVFVVAARGLVELHHEGVVVLDQIVRGALRSHEHRRAGENLEVQVFVGFNDGVWRDGQ